MDGHTVQRRDLPVAAPSVHVRPGFQEQPDGLRFVLQGRDIERNGTVPGCRRSGIGPGIQEHFDQFRLVRSLPHQRMGQSRIAGYICCVRIGAVLQGLGHSGRAALFAEFEKFRIRHGGEGRGSRQQRGQNAEKSQKFLHGLLRWFWGGFALMGAAAGQAAFGPEGPAGGRRQRRKRTKRRMAFTRTSC